MVARPTEDDELQEFLDWIEEMKDDSQDGFKNTERRFRKWYS